MLDDFILGKFVLQLDNKNYEPEFIERIKHIKFKGREPDYIINLIHHVYGNEGCIRYDKEVFRYGSKGFYEKAGLKVVPICEFIEATIERYNVTEDDLDSMFDE